MCENVIVREEGMKEFRSYKKISDFNYKLFVRYGMSESLCQMRIIFVLLIYH